jgi:hypothetical protein
MVYAYNRLDSYGKRNWLLENFRASGFCLEDFKLMFSVPLKFYALKSIFSAPEGRDYPALLMDFIEDEHFHHGQMCSYAAYKWAIEHFSECERMIKWRRLCYRFHELNILHSDVNELRSALDREIGEATRPLCELPIEILHAYRVWRRGRTMQPYEIYRSI